MIAVEEKDISIAHYAHDAHMAELRLADALRENAMLKLQINELTAQAEAAAAQAARRRRPARSERTINVTVNGVEVEPGTEIAPGVRVGGVN